MTKKLKDFDKHYQEALQYIRDNHKWSDAKQAYALEQIDILRCPLELIGTGISDEIRDLMDDFTSYHDLPDDWWGNDTDKVFFDL